MPTTPSPPRSGPTRVTRTYAVPSRNATSTGPPMPRIASGRPLANVVTAPVFGSTRETRPALPSVTYSAASGPTVLPRPPLRPETRRVAVGPRGGGCPPAAGGALAAKNRAGAARTDRSAARRRDWDSGMAVVLGLRYLERVTTPGAQTGRRGGAGPAGACSAVRTPPAAVLQEPGIILATSPATRLLPPPCLHQPLPVRRPLLPPLLGQARGPTAFATRRMDCTSWAYTA